MKFLDFITSDTTGKGNTGALLRFMYVTLFSADWILSIVRNQLFSPAEGILWLGTALFGLLAGQYIAPFFAKKGEGS